MYVCMSERLAIRFSFSICLVASILKLVSSFFDYLLSVNYRMPPPYFPLRWESTGDQWWYADPIDWAAANGLYDLVHHMLRRDDTLLTKLTSLRRIRRLETLWDDQAHFRDVARCRSYVARRLLHETNDSLIRAGHGGWLLYTAASAGNFNFVRELLDRDPFLVFGEGEYGVTDILYAAARSNNSEVFRFLFQAAVSSRGSTDGEDQGWGLTFRQEMMNRAAHAAARGGNVEILKEIIEDSGGGDALIFRDALGSTVLHSAAGRGQVEVVQYLIRSHDIITCVDNQGNTGLHVASYRGHLAVVELLLLASPLLASALTNAAQTFLHLAVASFQTPGFHRSDHQLDLIKKLLSGEIFDIREIINLTDRCGRTAFHLAVTGNMSIQPALVDFFINVPSIDLNVCDAHGMTALDLLKQLPRTTANEIVMKRLIAAGGVCNFEYGAAVIRPLLSDSSTQATHGSPGITFRVLDAEILFYGGTDDASNVSYDQESVGYSSACLSETSELGLGDKHDRGSVSSASRNWKLLLQWRNWSKKTTKSGKIGFPDDAGSLQRIDSSRWAREHVPLRLLHSDSSVSSNPSNKRMLSTSSFSFHTPSSSMDSVELVLGRQDWLNQSSEGKAKSMNQKQGSFDKRLMNKYLCFGAKGLAVEDTLIHCRRPSSFRRHNSLFASISS